MRPLKHCLPLQAPGTLDHEWHAGGTGKRLSHLGGNPQPQRSTRTSHVYWTGRIPLRLLSWFSTLLPTTTEDPVKAVTFSILFPEFLECIHSPFKAKTKKPPETQPLKGGRQDITINSFSMDLSSPNSQPECALDARDGASEQRCRTKWESKFYRLFWKGRRMKRSELKQRKGREQKRCQVRRKKGMTSTK